MNILQTMTGSVAMSGEFVSNISSENWMGISLFLFILLWIIVYTTSKKSEKIKKLERRIINLEKNDI